MKVEEIIKSMLEDARKGKLPMFLHLPGRGQMTAFSEQLHKTCPNVHWESTVTPAPLPDRIARVVSITKGDPKHEHVLVIDDTQLGFNFGGPMKGFLEVDENITAAVMKRNERTPENLLVIACVHENDADHIDAQCPFATTHYKMAPTIPLW